MEAKQVTKEYTGESKFKPVYLLYILILVAVIVVVGIVLKKRSESRRTYMSYDVEKSSQLAFSVCRELPLKDGVLRYARDGAEAVNADGKVLWNVSYTMSNPVAATCGSFAAVGDMGTGNLYMMDGTGSVERTTTEHPIVALAVSANEETAVLMDGGTVDYLVIYLKDGAKKMVEMSTDSVVDGIPVDVALSPNGEKMVLSFARFDNETVTSVISFYNFGEVGKNMIDGLTGKQVFEVKESSLYADVEFVTNDQVAVFGDMDMLLYEMEEIQSVTPITVPFEGTVQRIAYSDRYIGVLTEKQEAGRPLYSVMLYDFDGKVVENRALDSLYSGFRIEGNDVILYSDASLYIYRINGNDKFKSKMSRSISYVFAVDGKNHFTLIGDSLLEKIKLIGEAK